MFFCYSRFLSYNTRLKPLVWREEGSTAKEHIRRLLLTRLHYRLFNLSLYLAVLHPGINHLFDPLIQPVKLPWFPLQELLLRRKKYTTQSVFTNSLEISWNLTVSYTAMCLIVLLTELAITTECNDIRWCAGWVCLFVLLLTIWNLRIQVSITKSRTGAWRVRCVGLVVLWQCFQGNQTSSIETCPNSIPALRLLQHGPPQTSRTPRYRENAIQLGGLKFKGPYTTTICEVA